MSSRIVVLFLALLLMAFLGPLVSAEENQDKPIIKLVIEYLRDAIGIQTDDKQTTNADANGDEAGGYITPAG